MDNSDDLVLTWVGRYVSFIIRYFVLVKSSFRDYIVYDRKHLVLTWFNRYVSWLPGV